MQFVLTNNCYSCFILTPELNRNKNNKSKTDKIKIMDGGQPKIEWQSLDSNCEREVVF